MTKPPSWKLYNIFSETTMQITDAWPVARISLRTVGATILLSPAQTIGFLALTFYRRKSTSTLLYTALLCSDMTPQLITCTYITTAKRPSTLAELQAGREAPLHTHLRFFTGLIQSPTCPDGSFPT